MDGMPGLISQETIPVRESSDILVIAQACYKDTQKYCKTFLSDNFFSPFVDAIHGPIFKKIDLRRPKKMTAVCATRGIGKSTIARGIASKAICYAEKRFIVYLGKSATHAEMQTENLKKDLMSPEIRQVWGNVKAKVPGDVEESWSKKSWVAMVGNLCDCGQTVTGMCPQCGTEGKAHYTFVLPRGAGQQVRGLLWKAPDGKNVRPDLIIADDLEDSEYVDSEDWRSKVKEWFFSDVMQCFPKLDKNWEIFYIDTLKHEDSLMALLLEASDWDSIVLSACDENYKSLAPAFMTDEEIQQMVESYREKGLMDVFAREIMCMPISKEDAEFKPEYFQYYSEASKDFRDREPFLANIILVDPAKTSKWKSGETGIVVWGVDLEKSTMYLRYAAGEKLGIDEMFDRIIDLSVQYKVWVIGIEDTGLGEFGTHPLENEISRRGLHYQVEGLKARRGGRVKDAKGFEAGKVQRIKAMSAYYRKGLVKHNKIGTGAYELQLLGFPKSKRWDIIDAGAYIIPMMEHGALYMALEGTAYATKEEVDKEYADLEIVLDKEERTMSNDWMVSP